MDHLYHNEDSGHIAETSPNNTFIRPGMEVIDNSRQLITCTNESQKHAQHDCESTGTSSSRKRKRVSGQSHEDRSSKLERLQNIIFEVINKKKSLLKNIIKQKRITKEIWNCPAILII